MRGGRLTFLPVSALISNVTQTRLVTLQKGHGCTDVFRRPVRVPPRPFHGAMTLQVTIDGSGTRARRL